MGTSVFTRRHVMASSVSGLAAACLAAGEAVAADASEVGSAADPRLDLVTMLRALSPHASMGDQARYFEGLVGTWDVDYTDYRTNGETIHRSGEYVIGWVLDGRAVQDLFTIVPTAPGNERYIATSLRYFDPKSGVWHAVFIDPANSSIMTFTGSVEGSERIVFHSAPADGHALRWSYNDIRPESFVWREEESRDGGQSWRLEAEHHMTRRHASAARSTNANRGF